MKKSKVILFLLIILGLAYINNTYIINPIDPSLAFLIPRFNNYELHAISKDVVAGMFTPGKVRMVSVGIYLVVFFVANGAFIWLEKRKEWLQVHLIGFGGISLLLLLCFLVFRWTEKDYVYQLAVVLKGFLCSPVYSLILVFLMYFIEKVPQGSSVGE